MIFLGDAFRWSPTEILALPYGRRKRIIDEKIKIEEKRRNRAKGITNVATMDNKEIAQKKRDEDVLKEYIPPRRPG